jgi:hypothetical protein
MSWLWYSARRHGFVAAIVPSLMLLGLLAVQGFAGCALNREGGISSQCGSTGECDDANPCTADACGTEGFCEHVPTDAPLSQVDGDCAVLVCDAGQAKLEPANDPEGDGEACTEDLCVDGVTVHDAGPLDDEPCDAPEGQGQCQGGACVVECQPGDTCDDSNDCTSDFCDALSGFCEHDGLPDGPLPGSLQADGDCRLRICASGEVTDAFDDQDVLDDGNPCTDDLCDQGIPMNPPLALGAGCSDPTDPLALFCNALGDCVQCNGPSDCSHLPTDDECQTRTCSLSGVCGQDCTTAGTPLNQQIGGDCSEDVCDGGCGMAAMGDPLDVPVDNNDCTEDLCVNGSPLNPPSATGSMCGNGGVCNATGQCVGCNVASDCGNDSFCLQWSCDGSQICQPAFTANDTPLPAAQQIAQDCLENRCDGAGMVKQSQILDPIIDGNPCSQDLCVNGSPINPAEPVDVACPVSQFCDGNGACVQCNNDGQCSSDDGVCEEDVCLANNCMIVFDPPTDPAPQLPFQTDGDCKTVFCDGSGAVNPVPAIENGDLPNDNNECTQDVCTNGTPTNPPEPAETPCSTGVCNGDAMAPACVECATNAQCTNPGEVCDVPTGVCLASNGQGCAGPTDCLSGLCIDGLCCDSPCLGTCSACDVPGSQGTCSFVPFNVDLDSECPGGACDGMGACKKSDGQGCSLGAECLSDECVDSVCCDGPCSGTCQACNLSGSVGACTFVPFNVDLDNECNNGACDGAGLCKLDLGQGCGNGSQCLSTFCADSVCCDGACGGTCEACSAAGACTPHAVGTDPEAECAADVCNGNSACRCMDGLVNGAESDVDCGGGTCPTCAATQSCNVASDCTSGVCTAGSCQAPSCGDGVVNGAEVCDVNDPATPCCAGTCMGTAASGTACGADPDGTGCSAEPKCDGGGTAAANCQPDLEMAGTGCTDNNVFCDGGEFCDAGGTCLPSGIDPCPGPDGDGDCSETCNEASDACDLPDTAGSLCDDAQFCNGADTCGAAGLCDQHVGDPCVGPDGDGNCSESCNEAADVCNAPDTPGSACDDGLFCTGVDTCGATGACDQHAGDPCPGPDGDGDCNESCDDALDTCTLYDGELAACDDGLFCTGVDTCGGGTCSNQAGDPCDGPDGDGDCSETCNEAMAMCNLPDTPGSMCDDGLFCTGADTCGATGLCDQHVGDPCTGPDGDGDCSESCDDTADDCNGNDLVGSACDDSLFCNGIDTCNPGGQCNQHAGDPCPGPDMDGDCNESCDEVAAMCTLYDGDGASCNDGMGNMTCDMGTCSMP